MTNLYTLLGGTDEPVLNVFVIAWAAYQRTLAHLDDLSDDVVRREADGAVTTASSVRLLHDLFAATGQLDALQATSIPAHRLLRLHHLWNESALGIVSSKQPSATGFGAAGDEPLPRERYTELVKADQGAVYACAWGGSALLATENEELVAPCRALGEAYGTLLQVKNDLAAPPRHPDGDRAATRTGMVGDRDPHHRRPRPGLVLSWYPRILVTTLSHVEQAAGTLPPPLQAWVFDVFGTTFIR
jgi:hypothetical protein